MPTVLAMPLTAGATFARFPSRASIGWPDGIVMIRRQPAQFVPFVVR